MRLPRISGRIADWSLQYVTALYVGLVVFTNTGLALDYKFGTGWAPWLDLGVIALAVPLALRAPRDILRFLDTPFARFCCVLLALFALNWFRLRFGGYAYAEADLIDETNEMERVALWFALGFIVHALDPARFRGVLYLALWAMPLLVLIDFVSPAVLGPPNEVVSARAQGSYLNANLAAEAIVLLGVLNLARFRGVLGVVLFGVMALGVLVTFSRAGLIALVLFGLYLWLRGRLPRSAILAPVLLVAFYSTFLVYAEDILVTLGYEASVANVIERLSFFEPEGALEVPDDDSGESRAWIAASVWQAVWDAPFAGHVYGAEAMFGLDPHNQPLHYWYKYGIAGLGVWWLLVWMLARRRPVGQRTAWLASPALIAFVFFSMFSHNLLDARPWIVFYALILTWPVEAWHGSVTPFLGLRARRGRATRSRVASRAPTESPRSLGEIALAEGRAPAETVESRGSRRRVRGTRKRRRALRF